METEMPEYKGLSSTGPAVSTRQLGEEPANGFLAAQALSRERVHPVGKPAPKLESLSVFFPAYNEESNIGLLVEKALEVLPGITGQFEVIVVDDGSTDGTAKLADELARNHPGVVRAVHHAANQGYGGAVKTGFVASQYEWIFFTDGDRQFRLEELQEFVDHLRSDVDLLIGYRKKRQDPWHRSFNANLYKLAIRLLFGLKVRDIDCAYKLIHRQVINSMSLKCASAMVSAEFLIKAKQRGFIIAEVGVNHYPRVSGKQTGAKFSVIARAMWELVRNYKELRKAA
jgi:glycosyltransferase involved in cell wall biosynthesis